MVVIREHKMELCIFVKYSAGAHNAEYAHDAQYAHMLIQ